VTANQDIDNMSTEPALQVLLPAALCSYTGSTRVQARGASLHALFADLDARFPGLRFRVVDEQQQLRPNMRIFVNGRAVRDLACALKEGDEVAVLLALSGG
jgi:molybdopterin synthase sulfur carrier subunit